MGKREYKDILYQFEMINQQLQDVVDMKKENARLKKQVITLQMKVENYGMLMSGNPCRLTPPSWEVSKRLGYNTI
jgi:hypothetical protein